MTLAVHHDDRVDGVQLTMRHGQGPSAPAALDPVRGIMPAIEDQITKPSAA